MQGVKRAYRRYRTAKHTDYTKLYESPDQHVSDYAACHVRVVLTPFSKECGDISFGLYISWSLPYFPSLFCSRSSPQVTSIGVGGLWERMRKRTASTSIS